jgi:CubicO group peptidase (beta-lactamase class C family)
MAISTLAHAAGEFMGVLAGPQDRLVDAHLLQQLDNIGIDAGVALALGQDQRLGDLLADAQGRVEADHRVLGTSPRCARAASVSGVRWHGTGRCRPPTVDPH